MDFLLVLIELLLLGVTAEELWANIGSKSAISLQRGPVDPKFQVVGVAPTNLDRSFFHFVTNHAFHRRTDGQTEGQTNRILIARPRLHCMQRGNELLISDCSWLFQWSGVGWKCRTGQWPTKCTKWLLECWVIRISGVCLNFCDYCAAYIQAVSDLCDSFIWSTVAFARCARNKRRFGWLSLILGRSAAW